MAFSNDRHRLAVPATEAARHLLGAVLTHDVDGERVGVRITEVEAYMGDADPGSHAFRGQTARNATMFGPAGHLYVYFTYGMHYCANVVCGAEGEATGLLLRAGEIVEGADIAAVRRGNPRTALDLARGPARLAQALGIARPLDGADLFAQPLHLALPAEPVSADRISTGPRVGVSGPGGTDDYPWRYWLTGDPTVSKYRPAKTRPRPAAGATVLQPSKAARASAH
ncbi:MULTISPECIES: DNA-3-methyladenine glycosylase [unclassified Arthrobacter]|uniref:DNA-3-methyladenine glycosylase n=1 Tax=unclassified Arthrobacter TaxID=235627 RepID=UPI001E4CD5CA|nr:MULTISPECIES: DNA-3-methyladenine glycosylase [unclassified Arthrobacter]MCC9146340.1 DNA-3-methyladenine glycosylase [Arthrobacter sp. zg-Y919]MDK1277570.1 DNA-3-methyladenine glycosylase [Arthrobacter sp. zg.Y919]WIB04053.1 DNA-3-methyladenine glycosylase [Arthrobacter sp. zg-Y919]